MSCRQTGFQCLQWFDDATVAVCVVSKSFFGCTQGLCCTGPLSAASNRSACNTVVSSREDAPKGIHMLFNDCRAAASKHALATALEWAAYTGASDERLALM